MKKLIQWCKTKWYGEVATGEIISKPCGYHSTLPDNPPTDLWQWGYEIRQQLVNIQREIQ